jgi:hypothetical protein
MVYKMFRIPHAGLRVSLDKDNKCWQLYTSKIKTVYYFLPIHEFTLQPPQNCLVIYNYIQVNKVKLSHYMPWRHLGRKGGIAPIHS